MRIRSIKPEFWRSDDVDALDLADRLLFIGLWSYVDDNGVGRDRESDIAGDLFSGDLSRDALDTLARVRRGLATLSERGLVLRYRVAGKAYLAITNWSEHQKIDKPSRRRYPNPSEALTSANAADGPSLATDSRDPRDIPSPGAVEQGSSGTGEEEPPPAGGTARTDLPAVTDDERAVPGTDLEVLNAEIVETDAAVVPIDPPQNAGTLVAEWINHCANPPLSRIRGQVAKTIKALLEEGAPYEAVRRGVAEWHSRAPGSPGQLPSFVHEVMNPPTRARWASDRPNRQTPTDRAADAARMAAELQAEHDERARRVGA